MNNTMVSIIIPAYNCKDLLILCLEKLEKQTINKSLFQVIVVDDNSSDGTAEAIENIVQNISYECNVLRRNENGGPGAARNTGLINSKGSIIAFLDADTEPEPNWLEEGLKSLEGCDAAEGVTLIGSPEKVTPFTHQTENKFPNGFQTCNFVRRYVFEEIGVFDTRYYEKRTKIHFREDSDFALRMKKAGKSISFAKDAIVLHRPLAPKWYRPLQLARRYRHDRLLRQLHPDLYSKYIDVYRIAGINIRRLRQKIYWGYLFGVGGLAISILNAKLLFPVLIWTVICLAAVWWLHVRIVGIRAFTTTMGLQAIPVAALVPFVFARSIVAGIRLHPANKAKLQNPPILPPLE